MSAAMSGATDVVNRILGRNETMANAKDSMGRTPLMWAVVHDRIGAVRVLMKDNRVDANSRDSRGRTALFWAARFGRSVIVKVLHQGRLNDLLG